MLTLNIIGKKLSAEAITDENEVKILIEPSQFTDVKKILESSGFGDVILEDDEGNLYVNASKKNKIEAQNEPDTEIKTEKIEENILPVAPLKREIIKNSTGVLISSRASKFVKKFLQSLINSKIKPDVIALMNFGVGIAAYNSDTFKYLNELNSQGVKILISDSCADRMGVTEAIGVGDLVDLSEILEEIFSCGKVVNI